MENKTDLKIVVVIIWVAIALSFTSCFELSWFARLWLSVFPILGTIEIFLGEV